MNHRHEVVPTVDGWVRELDDAAMAGSGSPNELPADMECRQVLVVDDDEVIRRLVRAGLEREGFVVRDAPDGDAALEDLQRCPASLVILDVNLGTVGGFDVLSKIRASSDVPVILLTGRVSETDRVLGLELGADDYVVKPFSPRELSTRQDPRPGTLAVRRGRPGDCRSRAHESRFVSCVAARHEHATPAREARTA